ncbi:IS110 family transposase [Parasphingorhabdus cellanae]|uniref:IS110 family transposase n=1 Tax=Parasphingorhabdus cellanae TaxID=2806553 RepID=A0ABX7T8T5_9SPHN|nr:IS110 family transposase [Parasphingorhabdus cellanae]QTD56894.1 IS110 family transposase [Parasphingorhabdus cellanae]
MGYYVGLDVALRSVALCVVTGDGEIVLERALACEVGEIVECLRGLDQSIERVGFEAGTMSQTLFHGLHAAGYRVICMEARHVGAALSAMRNKTDRNDARGIAQVVRSGWYRPVHMKSQESHYVRTLLTSRKALLRRCIDLENEIRGLLKVFGIRLPSSLAHHRFAQTVRPIIEADEALLYALLPMLDAQQVLLASYQELDRRVKLVAGNDPVCMLLMTAPGVGAVTALHFKAAIDDPARFTSSRLVGAHFGLTPRRFQSGESDNQGRISKAGDPMYAQHFTLPQTRCSPEHAKCLRSKHGACIWFERRAGAAPLLLLPANLPSSSTACGSMAPSSNGMIRR